MSNKSFVIVVGTDFSVHSAHALRVAYEHAAKRAPAELHVLHASLAITPAGAHAQPPLAGLGLPLKTLAEQRADLKQHIDAELGPLLESGEASVVVKHHVVLEAPLFALTHFARAVDADLIVVGTHGRRGVARWLLGSVAEAAIRDASCPVLVVPPRLAEAVSTAEPASPPLAAQRSSEVGNLSLVSKS